MPAFDAVAFLGQTELSMGKYRDAAEHLTFAIENTPASKAEEAKPEKCYGVNAAGKNDCGAGSHTCAVQATMARDPKSFVLVPAGACEKIAGGSLKPM